MPKQPEKSKRSKKNDALKPKRAGRALLFIAVLLAAAAAAYFLFFSPVSKPLRPLPLIAVEPERLERYLDAQRTYQLPWYVFAGIDYAEYGQGAPMPTSARTAVVAARVSGAKQGNVSVSRGENEFEYATLKRMLERYPQFNDSFIDRSIEYMRSLSRISHTLENCAMPLGGDARYADEVDLHEGHVPGLIGLALYSNDAGVVSASSGSVVKCGWDDDAGYMVSVLTDDGVTLSYAHLASIQEGLAVGSGVEKGEKLGVLGDTGGTIGEFGAFSPHLLFCMQDGEFTVNPYVFLNYWKES